ncbi:MAG: uncharacterized protein JWN03_4326 [Nocardia sp.]|uniref:DUF1707 SHOCT-like domain-containing protein n=1 Tax=Nocardia sp. TaxID=1821 RepID=UPI0026045EDA|nr:DUF1707 domain-containing protein [Nocardia sp.]MCU1644051.1 uncharacterized protein [Nocardia sp.]
MDEPRVSAADRERALRELSQHFGDGRLTLTEFEDRSATAAAATYPEQLAELFVDLPAATPPFASIRASVGVSPLAILTASITMTAVLLFIATGNTLWLLLLTGAAMILVVRRVG